jgi:hypothetical protein
LAVKASIPAGSTAAEGRDSFIGKWRARWPEWQVAEAFLPGTARAAWLAWFALRQELTDAAWAGADPLPGEAKLAWWSEELQGWTQGRRRHPLGAALQVLPAPWMQLAAALPALAAARERATDLAEAVAVLAPFSAAAAGVEAALAGDADASGTDANAFVLLGQRALGGDDGAVPLQLRARVGSAASAGELSAAWKQELLRQWPPPRGSARGGRIHAALVRERLRQGASGAAPRPLPRWRALVVAWRAARVGQSVPAS